MYVANRKENILAASSNLNRNFGYQGRPSFSVRGRRIPSYRGAGLKSGTFKGTGRNFAKDDTSEHKSESANRTGSELEPKKKERQFNL